jgi:ubiquinone/menaquinone biosynthesis C-methylase UbiE
LSGWTKKRQVKECYDTTSDSYNEQYADEQDAKYKAAQKTLNNPQVYGNVLDVGCGSGLFFTEIAGKAQTVVGVDVSRSLLFKAQTQAKPFGNVHVIQADADHLPFKPQVFDAIFCFTVLQNMPAPNETLLEFKRQTQLDGKIVVTGLKKAFELTAFLDLFEDVELRLLEFIDDDTLKCYIAVTAPC